MAHTSSTITINLHSSSYSPLLVQQQLMPSTRSVLLSTNDSSSTIRPEFSSVEEDFISKLTSPQEIRTKSGKAKIKDLFLPPPPAVDVSSIVTPSSTAGSIATFSHTSSRASLKSPSSRQKGSVSGGDGRVADGSGGGNDGGGIGGDSGDVGRGSSALKSPVSGKRKVTMANSQASINKSKEKLLQPKREKYCLPGM